MKVEADTSFGVSGISVVLIPQSDRFKPSYVDERVDDAFVSFYKTHLQTDELIAKLFHYPKRIQESEQYQLFRDIQDQEGFPGRLRQLYKKHLPYVQETYETLPSYSKLSIQIQGNLRYESSVPLEPRFIEKKRALYETDETLITTSSDGIQHVQGKIVLSLPDDIRHENAYFITDLEKFRSSLKMYPSRAMSSYPDEVE